MKTPPLLLGTAMIFWGWQTQLIPLALLLALGIESHWILRRRWTFSRSDWSKVTDLCAIILLSILAYNLLQEEKQLVYAIGKMFPLILFPLLLIQKYSQSGKTNIAALSLIERKRSSNATRFPPADISPIYLFTILLAAGIGKTESDTYFMGLFLIGTWFVFGLRTRHFSLALWITLILLSGGLGFMFHQGLHVLENKLYEMSFELFNPNIDPFKTSTAIGDIGRQKLYNNILFRVFPENMSSDKLLLREACYNSFNAKKWYALNSSMSDVKSPDQQNWTLQKTTHAPYSIQIRSKVRKGTGVLPLPAGSITLNNLPAGQLQTNQLCTTVFTDLSEKYTHYRVRYNPEFPQISPPTSTDLRIPHAEERAIVQFTKQLQLPHSLPPDRLVEHLKNHFKTHFTYSLDHQGKGALETPLANFLLNHKSGHCELFATATVLALRAYGIPARYAVGYVAAEYSPLEKQYIVRQRHGHAWCIVYYNDQWHTLDTTSSNWLEMDARKQTPFRAVADLMSFLKYRINDILQNDKNLLGKIAAALVLMLIIMVINRLRKQKRIKKKPAKKPITSSQKKCIGIHSRFYHLESIITQKGYPRNSGETLSDWAERIEKAAPNLLDFGLLKESIQKHYALRFSESPQEQVLNQLVLDIEEKLNKPS